MCKQNYVLIDAIGGVVFNNPGINQWFPTQGSAAQGGGKGHNNTLYFMLYVAHSRHL